MYALSMLCADNARDVQLPATAKTGEVGEQRGRITPMGELAHQA